MKELFKHPFVYRLGPAILYFVLWYVGSYVFTGNAPQEPENPVVYTILIVGFVICMLWWLPKDVIYTIKEIKRRKKQLKGWDQ